MDPLITVVMWCVAIMLISFTVVFVASLAFVFFLLVGGERFVIFWQNLWKKRKA